MIFKNNAYVGLCTRVLVPSGTRGTEFSQELELQAAVSNPTWVLGTKSRPFARAGHALSH